MNPLEQKQAEAKAKMAASNPSVAPGKSTSERVRIPLSVPQRKLEVPEIPGYYLRWFRGTPARLRQAESAGFEYVTAEEVRLNSVSLGGDARKDGNNDLGSHVSVVEGSEVGDDGQAVRMILMKQKQEYRNEDVAIMNKRNDSVAEALTSNLAQGTVGGKGEGETTEDLGLRYVDKKRSRMPEFFRKKVRSR